MRTYRLLIILIAVFGFSVFARASKDPIEALKRAVERCTLNQRGTRAFHLLAAIEPSHPYLSRQSSRSGTVEIWWVSPTEWRQEVRTSGFHQIAIMKDGVEWQKNEGDYYPEWLRETAVALIEPIPHLDQVLDRLRDAEINSQDGMIQFSWTMKSTDGTVESELGAGVGINERTGLVAYGGGLGWDGEFLEYDPFHGRQIARLLHVSNPEVTATVMPLEKLGKVPPGFFDAVQKGGDAQLLHTVVVDEMLLRENLLPSAPPEWPAMKDGPLEGTITAQIAVDRTGKVREVTSAVATNPGLKDAARRAIAKMQFKPYLQDGVPVQVVSRITLPFKTTRATATAQSNETQRFTGGGGQEFPTVGSYFEFTRRICFPAAGAGTPYVLRATFVVRTAAGNAEEGQYVDTWIARDQWRREVTVGKSRVVRTQHGEKRYMLAEGPDATLLKMVLKLVEPIPAIDTYAESDWHIKLDTADGMRTLRVLTGYESPEGVLDQYNARGYWFDETGKLVRSYVRGIETRWSDFAEFSGVQVAHRLTARKGAGLVMLFHVTDVGRAGTVQPESFELPKHEWRRTFTDEVR
jgi:TonB family protein